MKIFLIDGVRCGGFAGDVETSARTIGELIDGYLVDKTIPESDLYIRVNRSRVDRDFVLHDGDKISILPPLRGCPSRPPFRAEFQTLRKEDQEYFLRMFPERREEWTGEES